uniref:Si:ch211-212d10.2 n=1 Tax=Petromyzon marinus TaxID=7757 RepID=S4REF7_PETMA
PTAVEEAWQLAGPRAELEKTPCRRLFSSSGPERDVAIIHDAARDALHAMDACCPHQDKGGPLNEGDIEDIGGDLKITCPWHYYQFDVKTGKSDTGLQQRVYEVKVEDGLVFVKCPTKLSLTPFKK